MISDPGVSSFLQLLSILAMILGMISHTHVTAVGKLALAPGTVWSLMVNKIDRPNTTPIGPMVLSLTFKVWLLRVHLLMTSLFCIKY